MASGIQGGKVILKNQEKKPHNDILEKLTKSEVFYRHVTELTPDAIVIHLNGHIVYANKSTLRLIKAKKASDFIGHSIMEFIHPRFIRQVKKRMEQIAKANGPIPIVEEHFVDLAGNIHIARVKSVPFSYEGQFAVLSLLQDITELKQSEEKLEKNDTRYHALIEHSSDVIALVNVLGKIEYVSGSIIRVLGYTQDEFIGKNSLKFIHPRDLVMVRRLSKEYRSKYHESNVIEVRAKHKNGNWVWVEVTFTNLLKDPALRAVVVNFRDISDRKRENARREFLEKASQILISSIDYEKTLKNIVNVVVPFMADYCRIVLVDESGTPREVAIKHISPQKLKLVKKLYASYRNDTSAVLGVEHLLKTGKPELMHVLTEDIIKRYKNNKGMLNVMEKLGLRSYMGIPLKARGRIVGAITFSSTDESRLYNHDDLLFAQDLAHRIALALDNAQLFLGSQTAIHLRDNFISVASHELKTPITSLKMYTQLLQRKYKKYELDEEINHYFRRVNDQINKIAVLISDLLNASKLQHGKLDLKRETFDLRELIEDTVEAISATDRNHTIILKGKTHCMVYADRYRIYQVLTNLLTNAIKYSPDAKKVIVAVSKQKTTVSVTVKDFGIGIDESHQKKIFSQFYRVSNPEEGMYPGLGMGLYISNEIIKKHNGKITVKSLVGKGSEFTFILPLVLK